MLRVIIAVPLTDDRVYYTLKSTARGEPANLVYFFLTLRCYKPIGFVRVKGHAKKVNKISNEY